MAIPFQNNASNRFPFFINPNSINVFQSYCPNGASAFMVMPFPPNCPENFSLRYPSLQTYSQVNNVPQLAPARSQTSKTTVNHLQVNNLLPALPASSQTSLGQNNVPPKNPLPNDVGPLPQYTKFNIPHSQQHSTAQPTSNSSNAQEGWVTNAKLHDPGAILPGRNNNAPLLAWNDLPPKKRKLKAILPNVAPAAGPSECVGRTPHKVSKSRKETEPSDVATKKKRVRGRKNGAKAAAAAAAKVTRGIENFEPRNHDSCLICCALQTSGLIRNENIRPSKSLNGLKGIVREDELNKGRRPLCHCNDHITPVSLENDRNSSIRLAEHESHKENVESQNNVDKLKTLKSKRRKSTKRVNKPSSNLCSTSLQFPTLAEEHNPFGSSSASLPNVLQKRSFNHTNEDGMSSSSESRTKQLFTQQMLSVAPRALYSSAKGVTEYNTTFSSRFPLKSVDLKMVGTSRCNCPTPSSLHNERNSNTLSIGVPPSTIHDDFIFTTRSLSLENQNKNISRNYNRNAPTRSSTSYPYLRGTTAVTSNASQANNAETLSQSRFDLPRRSLLTPTAPFHQTANRDGTREGVNCSISWGQRFPLDLSVKSNRVRDLDGIQHYSAPNYFYSSHRTMMATDVNNEIATIAADARISHGEVYRDSKGTESNNTDYVMIDSEMKLNLSDGQSMNVTNSQSSQSTDQNNNLINKKVETPEIPLEPENYTDLLNRSSTPVLVIDENYESDEGLLPSGPGNCEAGKDQATVLSQEVKGNGSHTVPHEKMNFMNKEDQSESENCLWTERLEKTNSGVTVLPKERTDGTKDSIPDSQESISCSPAQYSKRNQTTAGGCPFSLSLIDDDSESGDYSTCMPRIDTDRLKKVLTLAYKDTARPKTISHDERSEIDSGWENNDQENFWIPTLEGQGYYEIDGGNSMKGKSTATTDQKDYQLPSGIAHRNGSLRDHHELRDESFTLSALSDFSERTTSMIEGWNCDKSTDGLSSTEYMSVDSSREQTDSLQSNNFERNGNCTYRIERRQFPEQFYAALMHTDSSSVQRQTTMGSYDTLNRQQNVLGNFDNSTFKNHGNTNSIYNPNLVSTQPVNDKIFSNRNTESEESPTNALECHSRQTPSTPHVQNNQNYYEDISEDEASFSYPAFLPPEPYNGERMTSTPLRDFGTSGENHEQRMDVSSFGIVKDEVRTKELTPYEMHLASIIAETIKQELGALRSADDYVDDRDYYHTMGLVL